MRLHVGCFDQPVDGWHNTDGTPHLRLARVPGAARMAERLGLLSPLRARQRREGVFRRVHHLDVTRPLPFASGSVDAIFSSHVLEHLDREVTERFLAEAHRVLRPGGVIRTVLPDLDQLVAAYQPEEADDFVERFLEASQSGKNRHRWMYNEASFSALLHDVGFDDVRRCPYRQGACPDLELLDNRPDTSLFIEATR